MRSGLTGGCYPLKGEPTCQQVVDVDHKRDHLDDEVAWSRIDQSHSLKSRVPAGARYGGWSMHISANVAVDKLINTAVEKAVRKVGSDKIAHSVKEIVEGSSLSRSTVYKGIRTGKLRSHRIGTRRVILPEDLQRWLEGQPPTAV
jgi:excisionase family DNA binding protein